MRTRASVAATRSIRSRSCAICGDARLQRRELALERRVLETVAHRLQQPLACERLFDEVVNAEAERFDGLGHGGLAGDDDGGHAVDAFQKFDAGHPVEPHVDEHQVRLLFLHELERSLGA